jgi:transcriptional regulator with XRE-family HTH domain
MIIGDRLRQLREQKNMSQGHIGEKTGLMPAYISRVENGHTVPSVATLEKFARALQVPIYQLFYEGEELPPLKPLKAAPSLWGSSGKDAQLLAEFRRSFSKIEDKDRRLLLDMARKLAKARLHNEA